MKQKYMSILVIFNILIFSVITVFSGIMLFHASYAVPTEWDGTMGTGFAGGNGSSSNPYLISNGKQLAYFISRCNEKSTYRSRHYKLTADITLNEGFFDYKNEFEIYYYKNNNKYFVKDKDKYYDSSNQQIGSLHQLPISNFEFNGSFDGDGHIIYGLYYYYDGSILDNFGFFNITGSSSTVKNIKLLNSVIIGNSYEAGFIGLSCGNVKKIIYSGIIKNLSIEENIGYNRINANTIYLNSYTGSTTNKIFVLKGVSDQKFRYNGNNYNAGRFFIESNSPLNSVTLQSESTLNLSNVSYYYIFTGTYTGLIAHASGSVSKSIDMCVVSGKVEGASYDGVTGAILGVISAGSTVNNNVIFELNRSYSTASVSGCGYVGGIVGSIYTPAGTTVNISNVYNAGTVRALQSINTTYTGGLVGGHFNSRLKFSNCINHSTYSLSGQFLGKSNDIPYISTSKYNYYTKDGEKVVGNYNGSITGITYRSFADISTHRLRMMRYVDYNPAGVADSDASWILNTGELPYLYFDDRVAPNVNVSINISGETKSWNNSVSNRSSAVLYDNDEQKTVNYTSSDSNEIALVEYRVVDNIFFDGTLGVGFDDALMSISNSGSIDISNNYCSVVYVRATDIYGNVSYAYTDIIMSGYKTTKYVDSEADNDIMVDKVVMSDSVLNINFKQQFSVVNNSFMQKTPEMYQYLQLVNKLPVGTKLSLYDSRNKNTYIFYIDNNTQYISQNGLFYIPLSNFYSILDASTFYNNDFHSFSSFSSFDCDITLSFEFPDILDNGSKYYFSDSANFSGLVNLPNDTSFIPSMTGKIDTIVASINYYYDTEYYLDSNFSDINIQTNSLSNSYTLNFDVSKIVPITPIDGHDYIIRSKRNGYKNFKLYVELVGPNNEKLSPFVGSNFKYTLISNGVSKVFNNKTNSVAMADFVINNWNYTGPASDGDNEYKYNFDVKVDLEGNNFRDILPNDGYKLKFWILPSDDYASINPKIVPVTIDSPKVFDGYSFQSSIDRNDRIFDHETGKNLNNNNYITYNYSYNLYSGNSQYLLYRILKGVQIDPSTVLQPNSYTLSNSYFKLNSNACLAGTTGCYERLILKDNIPEGSYFVEVFLMRGNTAISQDYFNFIVK